MTQPLRKFITIQLKISSALQSGYVTQFVADKLQYIQQSQFRSAIYRHCPTWRRVHQHQHQGWSLIISVFHALAQTHGLT